MKKFISAMLASITAASLLISAVSADGDIVLKPGEATGLTKISDSSKEVTFDKTSASKDWIVGGESDGQWLIGGDNGDIGISLDMLKNCEKLELDYTCDNPIAGTKIGFAFKVHVDLNSRTCEDGGYVFADYLPATWVPYGSGSDGKQPIKAVNSLDTIYKTDIKDKGTLSVNAADLLKVFPEDMDYMMGLGIGADNKNDDISEDDDSEEYTVDVTEIRFVMKAGAQQPEKPAGTVSGNKEPDKSEAPNTGIEGVAVVAGLAVLATGTIIVAKKRK